MNFIVKVLLTLSCAAHVQALHRDAKIAIVGGGVSGLSAARTLTKHGFSHVTVFEKGNKVVPLQQFYQSEKNNFYDMDLIYIPSTNWFGADADPEFIKVIDEYKSELINGEEYKYINRDYWMTNASFPMISTSDGKKIPLLTSSITDIQFPYEQGRQLYSALRRFMRTHFAFFQKNKYGGINECYKQGIAYKNETFNDWVVRYNYQPMFFYYTKPTLALFGNSIAGNVSACSIIMQISNVGTNTLAAVASMASKQPYYESLKRDYSDIPNAIESAWQRKASGDYSAMIKKNKFSYNYFFTHIVEKEHLDFRLNTEVTKINPVADKVEIQLKNTDSLLFDIVIVAGRPSQVHYILDQSIPMKSLYEQVATGTTQLMKQWGVYGSMVIRADVHPEAQGIMKSTFCLDHMDHLSWSSIDIMKYDVNVLRICKPYLNENIMQVLYQTVEPLVDSKKEVDEIFKVMSLYGLSNLDILKNVHYPNTTTRIPLESVIEGWHDKAEKAQGVRNIYFIGETFSSHGVPTVFLHTDKWIRDTFQLDSNWSIWQNIHYKCIYALVGGWIGLASFNYYSGR